jgi:hypothetical protein
MDHYTFTIRAPSDDTSAATYNVDVGDIRKGQYRAFFKMLGIADPGYLSVRWPGVTNYANSRGDGKVIAACFGSYDTDNYHGVLYLSNPQSQIQMSWYGEDDVLLSTQVKPIVSVELQRIS